MTQRSPWQQDVETFMEIAGQVVKAEPATGVADGLVDLLYVTIGTAAAYGIDLEATP